MRHSIGHYLEAAGGAEGRKDNFLLIRLVAATLVIYGHGFALAALGSGQRDFFTQYLGYRYSGDVAVAVFFLISGFLVAGSLERSKSIVRFALARAMRLFPGLWVCVLVCALVMGPLITVQSQADYWSSPQTWTYVWSNASLAEIQWLLPGVFESNRYSPAVNGSLWTLPIEGSMYLYMGLLGLLGIFSWRWLTTALIAGFAIWTYQSAQLQSVPLQEAARLTLFFACGALFYIHKTRIPLHLSIVAVLAVVAWACRHTVHYELACSAALIYFVFWLAYVPRLPSPRWLLDISYGTYLYGWPIQQLIAKFYPAATPLQMTVIAIPLTWVVALMSWKLVEEPALKLFKTWSKKDFSLPFRRKPVVGVSG